MTVGRPMVFEPLPRTEALRGRTNPLLSQTDAYTMHMLPTYIGNFEWN
jgi:hypothetical protein